VPALSIVIEIESFGASLLSGLIVIVILAFGSEPLAGTGVGTSGSGVSVGCGGIGVSVGVFSGVFVGVAVGAPLQVILAAVMAPSAFAIAPVAICPSSEE
jgi:hypothetical protein